jgi:hypothetical protein
MKKLALLAAACAALLTTAAAATASGTSGSSRPVLGKPTVTMRFLEVQTGMVATAPLSQRPTFGERLWFHSDFYKWNGTKRGAHLGHANSSGVVLPAETMEITGVASLPGGTITVVGQGGMQRGSTLAVVGGTGIYATARGEVVIQQLGGRNSNTSADVVRLWT